MTDDHELLEELRTGLLEEGVDASEADIQSAIHALQKEELSEDDLEEVAGGRLIAPILPPIPQLLAICPRCRRVYLRRKGHHCSGGGSSGAGHSGGGRHEF